MSAGNEETAPLLTLSEIQISPDVLDAISEEQEHLETLEEGDVSTNAPSFLVGDQQDSPTKATDGTDIPMTPLYQNVNADAVNSPTPVTNGTDGVKIEGAGNGETTA